MILFKNFLKFLTSFFIVLLAADLLLSTTETQCNFANVRYFKEINTIWNPIGSSFCIFNQGEKNIIHFDDKGFKSVKYKYNINTKYKHVIMGSSLALGWPYQEGIEHHLYEMSNYLITPKNCSTVDFHFDLINKNIKNFCHFEHNTIPILILTFDPNKTVFSSLYNNKKEWINAYKKTHNKYPNLKVYYDLLDKSFLKKSTLYKLAFKGFLTSKERYFLKNEVKSAINKFSLSGEIFYYSLDSIFSNKNIKPVVVIVPDYFGNLTNPKMNNDYKYNNLNFKINKKYLLSETSPKDRLERSKRDQKYFQEYKIFKKLLIKNNYPVVDMFTYFNKKNFNNYFNGIWDHHPNKNGYQFISKHIYLKLKELNYE